MRAFSSEELEPEDDITELTGSMGTQLEEGLMHSVLESDQQGKDAKLLKESLNQGFSSFVPDAIFKNLVTNYTNAQRLYGKTFIRLVSGYDADYVGKNVRIPEFQQELNKRIQSTFKRLEEEGLTARSQITQKGIEAASAVLLVEELDHITPSTMFGEWISKKRAPYGTKEETRTFRRSDRYHDIALRRSLNKATKRGHATLLEEDLETFQRKSHHKASIVYAIDASGSMKGGKIDVAKKAGVALAFKAIQNRDKIGLVLFSKEVTQTIPPTTDFVRVLKHIAAVTAGRETDLVAALDKAIELLGSEKHSKHLILITDALPTIGAQPHQETIEAAGRARNAGVTISLVGINLQKDGEELAKKIVEIGNGRLYNVRELEGVDRLLIQEYDSISSE